MPVYLLALVAVLLTAVPEAGGAQEVHVSEVPDSVRLVTEDIPRFWAVFDQATPETLPALLQTHYLDVGTPGVQDFTPDRIISAERLAAKILEDRERYEAARARSLGLLEMERAIRAPLFAMEYLYPDAVYPDVYFIIGRFNSGGTASPRGLLIGAEMVRDPGNLPKLVAHEAVHFQQPTPVGPITLLAQSIREGAADFIAELASGRPPSAAYMPFGLAHEAELWPEFRQAMGGAEMAGWLYGGQPEGRPADLGYFFGYRIAESYYDRATDKHAAVREIIQATDFEDFLARSGYDPTP